MDGQVASGVGPAAVVPDKPVVTASAESHSPQDANVVPEEIGRSAHQVKACDQVPGPVLDACLTGDHKSSSMYDKPFMDNEATVA